MVVAGVVVLASVALTAVAQQLPDWVSSLKWTDGKEIQWRATRAPGCDGSNVEIRLLNNSTSSGTAKLSQATFACVRPGQYVGSDRDIGVVSVGQSASIPGFNCACAEKGGVTELLSANLEFTRNGAGSDTLGDCSYTGDFVNGERFGKGVYTCPGYRYEGAFRANKRNGYGAESLPTGEKYEGQFVDDMHQGQGKMTYTDGSTYDGGFVANQRDGVGNAKFKDGSRYLGEWKADRRVGHGTYTSADEKWTYDGDWSGNVRNGHGKLAYADGSYTYEGPFKNDVREGEGMSTFGDGRVFKGTFVNNVQTGHGELTYPSGRKIVGDFRNEMPNGHAVETGPSGSIDGMWVDGALSGKVSMVYPTGEKFDGMYQGGKRNGVGTETRLDGSKQECTWVNDVAQQPCVQITKEGKRIEFRSPAGGKTKGKN